MTPTPEQAAIVEAARDTTDNLLVRALAGTGKTGTLVLVAQAVPSVNMLCLAFNKRIAVEMQDRLPSNCQAMTLNSLGHRVWSEAIGKRLRIDARKGYGILKVLVDGLTSKRDKDEAWATFADILQAVAFGKSCGYVPDGHFKQAKRLMSDDEFNAHLEEEPSDLVWSLIREASLVSLKEAMLGSCDFDDQILMPTVFPAYFPQFPLVLVDEAQDLSALNHATLKKLAKKRLIAVGDECQSIYGFRGAHENSMALLEDQFKMKRLVLSVSFRCPEQVVREAWWRAPHMRWPEWAKQGTVTRLQRWSKDDLPDTATILCRNNAPLFGMAIQLLKNGRFPQLVGNDLGKNLIKTLRKLGPSGMTTDNLMFAISKWEQEKLKKSRAARKVMDQAECLRIFARQGANLGDAIAYAEHILAAAGPINLMTVHKAKGLEWETVFLLDKFLIRLDEQQDANLLYVAQTRTKERLIYVESAGFHAGTEGLAGGTGEGSGERDTEPAGLHPDGAGEEVYAQR